MHQLPGRVLISQEQIAQRVRELGHELAADLGKDLARDDDDLSTPGRVVLIPILTGAVVFLADLIRQMPMHMSMSMVSVSSYPGASKESKGASLRSELPRDLGGKHVVLVDDILDTGRTLSLLQRLVGEQSPASLRTCVLLKKDCPRLADADAQYVGFEIPSEFVVGYGLDYDGHYRNLPEICVLEDPASEGG
jgi:hypoxanthine phosphoribosyltransferase